MTLAGQKEQNMTKAEGAAVSELLSVAEDILEECLRNPGVETVKIDKFKRQRLMDGYTGVMSMITGHRQSAQEKLATNKTWMAIIRNRNHQLKLTDDKGGELEAPAVREVMETVKQQTIMDQIDSGKWADPKATQLGEQIGKPAAEGDDDEEDDWEDDDSEEEADDDQADHDEEEDEPEAITETAENGAVLKWPAITGVPPEIVRGIIQAVRDAPSRGDSAKSKVCAKVAELTGLDTFAVAGFFEELLKQGCLERRGNNYVAHQPNERQPAEASIG